MEANSIHYQLKFLSKVRKHEAITALKSGSFTQWTEKKGGRNSYQDKLNNKIVNNGINDPAEIMIPACSTVNIQNYSQEIVRV